MKVMPNKSAIKIPIYLTPTQIREAYKLLLTEETNRDWMDDPAILELLAEREKKVAEEIKKGNFTSLEDLQSGLQILTKLS